MERRDLKMKFKFSVEDSAFKKSSYTNPGGIINRCVAVAITPDGVAVRNSNDKSKNTVFYTRNEWKAFIDGVKNNEFEV